MRYIKLIIFSVVFFFIALLAVSFFIPSQVRISRAINLNPGSDTVLNLINDLSRWKQWYPGLQTKKLSNQKLTGQKVTEAMVDGIRLQIVSANDSLVNTLFKGEKKPVQSSWQLIHYPHSDSITLQQYMVFNIGWYPWDKLSSMVLDKTHGSVMEQGLLNLKNRLQ